MKGFPPITLALCKVLTLPFDTPCQSLHNLKEHITFPGEIQKEWKNRCASERNNSKIEHINGLHPLDMMFLVVVVTTCRNSKKIKALRTIQVLIVAVL
jgi:hypothetical protein